MDANFFFNPNPRQLLGLRASPVDRLAQALQGLNLACSSPVGNLGFLETQSPPPMSYQSDVNLFSPRRNPLLDSPCGHCDTGPGFPRRRTCVVDDHSKSFRFQNYLETCSHEEIASIVHALTRNPYTLVHMAKNQDSVNFVKKLIEVAKRSPSLLNRITSVLGNSGAYQLMVDLNGYKLILHCLTHLRAQDNLFIYETAVRFCSQLAKTVKGFVCLKECISKSSTQYRNLIASEIVKHSVSLATDSQGNFLVQFVIDLHNSIINRSICARIAQHLEYISVNKNGSYVVEKCLKSDGGEILIEEFLRLSIDKLEGLATDPHGNYVLQCAIKLDKKAKFHDELVDAIRQLPYDLLCDKYAKNVMNLVRAPRRGNVQY